MKSFLLRSVVGAAVMGAAWLCASAAWAQSSEAPPPPPPGPNVFFFERTGPGPMGLDGGIGFVSFEGPFDQKVVTGAPFTATISQETTQTLGDGNRIVRDTTGSFARDSQGRVRRDVTLPAIGPWAASGKQPPRTTFISDPVAGTRYVLDANRKVAHEMRLRSGSDLGPRGRFGTSLSAELQKETTTVSLGTQTINGVSAEGTRTIRTIPAGEIGNEKPITITVERWYSPDLQTVILLKHTDPMVGDSVYQLTNIQRTEPDETLFQVPSDYTVKQGHALEIRKAEPLDQGPDAQ
ncbi:MAG TPA: hypothetical protein VMJ93_09300 [Verrucomicrobiae bacterium]|nr:hypothetical protein [Verrucomicrobiae bacterium]